MDSATVNEAGERIIPASRRSDGTYRKEVRVRAGYVPQDEQPVYQSKGALAKQGVPKVPGLDDSDLAAAKAAAKSKSAKKNEKRKQKKTTDAAGSTTVDAFLAHEMDSLQLSRSGGDPSKSHDDEGADTAATTTPLEKKIRALRKKLKQAEALIAKQSTAGEVLTGPEREKVEKASSWREEIMKLEQHGTRGAQ